jgi:hypothetical protein
MGEAFKTACTLIELRPIGPLVTNRGSNLLPFPPPPLRDLPRRRRQPDEREGRNDLFGRRQGAYALLDRTTRRLGFFGGFVDRAPILLERDDAARELSLLAHPD